MQFGIGEKGAGAAVQDYAAVEGRPHVEAACRRHRAVDPQQRDGAEALLAVRRVAEARPLQARPEAARVVPGDYTRRDTLPQEHRQSVVHGTSVSVTVGDGGGPLLYIKTELL